MQDRKGRPASCSFDQLVRCSLALQAQESIFQVIQQRSSGKAWFGKGMMRVHLLVAVAESGVSYTQLRLELPDLNMFLLSAALWLPASRGSGGWTWLAALHLHTAQSSAS
jgi:hypothetical protein